MISTKGRYALRIMVDLSEQKQDVYTPLKDIAKRQEISIKYLESITKILTQANLLEGVRGKGGGYRLTRKPSEYNIGEIIELAEGTLAPVACLTNPQNQCNRSEYCKTLPVWTRFYDVLRNFFYNITLEDVLNGNFDPESKVKQ